MRTIEDFEGFPKIARLNRPCIITEKIDGTNAQVFIDSFGDMAIGSRTRWITPENDNFGFAAWCMDHKDELLKLGPGRHFGEWWGSGIQRGYGLAKGERRFSLFNVQRWTLYGEEPKEGKESLPQCVGLVPVLWEGRFSTGMAKACLDDLAMNGSRAAPGFMKPEGIVIYHVAGNVGFKATIEKDDEPKSITNQPA